MSFAIELYVNSSENNRLVKDIGSKIDLTGTLRSDCSIIDPIIQVTGSAATLSGYNYMRIASFGRYYYIRNIISVRTNLIELHCHCDVLMSFSTGILENEAILKRSESEWNTYLNDGVFKFYQNPMVVTKAFPGGFTAEEMILAVAGG